MKNWIISALCVIVLVMGTYIIDHQHTISVETLWDVIRSQSKALSQYRASQRDRALFTDSSHAIYLVPDSAAYNTYVASKGIWKLVTLRHISGLEQIVWIPEADSNTVYAGGEWRIK